MKKYLLKLQKRNKERLTELRGQLEKGEVRAEDLEAVQKEVDELNGELQEIADKLENMDDEKEENSADQENNDESDDEDTDDTRDGNDKGEGTDNADNGGDSGQRSKGLSAEQRDGIMSKIGAGLSTKGHKSTAKKEKEIRSAFANFVVGNISEAEARSLGIVVGQGSVTVPESIATEIITYAQEENLLRKYGSRHQTKGNVKYPILVKKAEANVSKTERTSNMPETEIEFDEILLDPAEFDALATVSKKLVKMSGVDIENIVVDELKKAYVRKETSYMFNGNDVGHENPGALAKKAVAYYENVAIDPEAIDDQKLFKQLVKLKGQPVTEVLKKSMWIVNRAALTVLEAMTDTAGRPLLHEATDGVPYKFLGHKLDFTDAADGEDSTKPVFYFGDFKAFHIQDVVGQLEIQRLVEQYAAKNKIGFQVYNLLDGQLVYSPLEPAVYRYEVGATVPTP